MRSWGFALVIALGAACGDGGAVIDAPPPDDLSPTDAASDANTTMPDRLADTGLCVDAGCTQTMPGVVAYTPAYELYSDGATKRRWIQLPAGETIDTTDMNHWRFPVGTKLWKEFTRGGTRVETRYITKLLADDDAPGAWFYAAYEWNAAQDATTRAPASGVMNANGTDHDIPSRTNCRYCHEGVPGRVLGFQAMSLDFDGATGELDLDEAIELNLLSVPPIGPAGGPYFPVPGTAIDHAAFGYLHANCGGCHNPTSATFDKTTLELRLDTTRLATIDVVPARVTTVGVNGVVQAGGGTELLGPIVVPGDPDASVMILRFTATSSPPKMPEVGVETTDPAGEAAIRAWISQPP